MPENIPAPLHADHVLTPPKWPRPNYLISNLPKVARMGFVDVCDGETALGDYQIQTIEEADIARASYTGQLRALARTEQQLPDELDHKLQIKLGSRFLYPEEHVYLGLGFTGERRGSQITALAQLRDSPALTNEVLDTARQLGMLDFAVMRTGEPGKVSTATALIRHKGQEYIGTASRLLKPRSLGGYALFDAFAKLQGIDPATLPDYAQNNLTPKSALLKHIRRFGGPSLNPDKLSTKQARRIICERYRAEFEDQIFYPEPEEALHTAYGKAELFWQSSETAHGVQYTHMRVERRGKNGVDTYVLAAHGPTSEAARRGAARIILRHIGATDPALLQP